MEEDYYKVKKAQQYSLIIAGVIFGIGALICFVNDLVGLGFGIIIGGAIEIMIQYWFNYLFLLKIKGPMIIIEQNKQIIETLSKISNYTMH